MRILKKSTILAVEKGTTMQQTQKFSRSTLNGAEWEIIVDGFGVALYLNNNYSGYCFRSLAEANAFLDRIDEKYRTPQPSITPCNIPANYYGVPGRYYGD